MNKTKSLRSLLSGGDRRSIAQSNRALGLVRSNRELVAQLAALAQDTDWLVSMRAMDLLEKLAHEHPDWVEPFKDLFIGPLADSEKWEVRLQVVRALPLFAWSPEEKRRAIEILLRDAEHPQTFVRAWAVDSLALFAEKNSELMPKLRRHLRELEESGSKALVTRARKIRSRLESRGDSRTR
jgi:HEAT repeat protein